MNLIVSLDFRYDEYIFHNLKVKVTIFDPNMSNRLMLE